MKQKWTHFALASVTAALTAVLLVGCGLFPERQLAKSSEVPAGEIRQQYELDINEKAGTLKARAYFLRTAGRIEYQVLLRGGSTIHLNGAPMTEVTRERDAKNNPPVAFYELEIPLPADGIELEWVSPEGQRYRNRVDVPPAKLKTNLALPIQRGEPFTLEFSMPAGAALAPNRQWLNLVPEVFVASPRRSFLHSEDTAVGRERAGAVGTWDFSAEGTHGLQPGKARLVYSYRVDLPLQQSSPAPGGFIRVHYSAKPLSLTVVDKKEEEQQ